MKLSLYIICATAFLTLSLSTFGKDPAADKPKPAALAPICSIEEAAEFKALAKATIEAIDADKKADVVTKITALESAWDAKEKTLKPKNPATWRNLDKTLDAAISALRGSKTDLPRGKLILEGLIIKLDQATLAHTGDTPAPAPAAPADSPDAHAAATPSAVYTAKELAEFKSLTTATLALLNADKITDAVAKLTDLETAWDAKEDALKPRSPATWTLLDSTLDEAIGTLRSTDKKDVPAGKATLQKLLTKLDQATEAAQRSGR